MLTIILLVQVHLALRGGGGHHLSLVMNGIKGPEEGQVWATSNISNGIAGLY
jgi:hypothetical protein